MLWIFIYLRNFQNLLHSYGKKLESFELKYNEEHISRAKFNWSYGLFVYSGMVCVRWSRMWVKGNMEQSKDMMCVSRNKEEYHLIESWWLGSWRVTRAHICTCLIWHEHNFPTIRLQLVSCYFLQPLHPTWGTDAITRPYGLWRQVMQ